MFETTASNVRPARLEDIPRLVELCAAHAAYEHARYDASGKSEGLIRALFADSPRLYCWLAERDKQVVGYATATRDYATWDAAEFVYMDCLYLGEKARGYGLGKQLVQEVVGLAQAIGAVNVQWQTPSWNKEALKFYERLGALRKDKVRLFLEPGIEQLVKDAVKDSD